jgi:hypothetical protein
MHSPLSIPSLAEKDANAKQDKKEHCIACNAMPALKSKKHAKSRSTRPVSALGNTKPTVPYLPREATQKPSSRPENSPLVALAPLSRRQRRLLAAMAAEDRAGRLYPPGWFAPAAFAWLAVVAISVVWPWL